MYFKLKLRTRSTIGVQENIRKLQKQVPVTHRTCQQKDNKQRKYQKEHALLKSFAGKLLKAAFAEEVAIGVDNIINPYQISLQFDKFDKIFLQQITAFEKRITIKAHLP